MNKSANKDIKMSSHGKPYITPLSEMVCFASSSFVLAASSKPGIGGDSPGGGGL